MKHDCLSSWCITRSLLHFASAVPKCHLPTPSTKSLSRRTFPLPRPWLEEINCWKGGLNPRTRVYIYTRSSSLHVYWCPSTPKVSLLFISAELCCLYGEVRPLIRFEGFTAVTMKNVVFWEVPPCGSFKNRQVSLLSVRRFRVTVNVVPGLPILVTLMMGELRSSETSVLTRATRLNITKDGILHSHNREIIKSYIALTGWAV
jgi:hypothetical protein